MGTLKKIVSILSITISVIAQERGEFFPSGLNIQPFSANYLEPKLGFLFNLNQSVQSDNQNTLRLEIGNSIDVYRYKLNENAVLSFGADLFTYSRLRSEDNFKFPVETIDYLFGLNVGYKTVEGNRSYGLRVRFSHISAHLVDGLYRSGNFGDDNYTDWTNSYPFVYSKEFVELIPFYSINELRGYAGLTYNYNIKPAELGKTGFQLGFDYFNDFFDDDNIYPFAAYDLRVTKLKDYAANHSVNLGIKLGNKHGRGFSIYLHYFDGNSIHGEFWYRKISYTALGFNLDL